MPNSKVESISSFIIRLKEARERSEAEWAEEAEGLRRVQSDLRVRLDAALRDLDEKSTQLSEVREEVAQLRSSCFKRDTEVSQLQAQLRQRDAEMSAFQLEKQMVCLPHFHIAQFQFLATNLGNSSSKPTKTIVLTGNI